jgi:fructokinase
MNNKTNNTINLLSFGEILWDIIEGIPHLGGAPFNLAAHAAHLGINTYLLSSVGQDELGTKAIHEAIRFGVRADYINTNSSYPTGTVEVYLSGAGQPEYKITEPAAWDFIPIQPIQNNLPIHVVCFGTLAQRNAVSRKALHDLLNSTNASTIFYDVNLRNDYHDKDIIEWGLERATIVKMNEDEAKYLSLLLFDMEMIVDFFVINLRKKYNIDILVITLGAKGCIVSDETGIYKALGQKIQVVDTVGSGDAFSACFLTAILSGKSSQEAARYGNILGAFVASQSGAVPEYSHDTMKDICNICDDTTAEQRFKISTLNSSECDQ